jgi:hypothetical protein
VPPVTRATLFFIIFLLIRIRQAKAKAFGVSVFFQKTETFEWTLKSYYKEWQGERRIILQFKLRLAFNIYENKYAMNHA